MEYPYEANPASFNQRKTLSEKVLCLTNHGKSNSAGVIAADISNAYTGDDGLHDLQRGDFKNYHEYSDAKREIESGQFFTSPPIRDPVVSCLKPSAFDLIADLTCRVGNSFNFLSAESGTYGYEIDHKVYKIAHYLYPKANIGLGDICTYESDIRFDFATDSPPFHLRWCLEDGSETLSQTYYYVGATELLKPLGIMALIIPQSFLADTSTDGRLIQVIRNRYNSLRQVVLPDNASLSIGAGRFPIKSQPQQRWSGLEGWIPLPYAIKPGLSLAASFHTQSEAKRIYDCLLEKARSDPEVHKSHILLELARSRDTSAELQYKIKKLLYHIRMYPETKSRYIKCCEYLHRFHMERKPNEMTYEEWRRVRITEKKVLSYLRKILRRQNSPPE